MEGTGSFGAGLARWLSTQGVAVVEVDRPDRRTRRRRGKSDSVDAEAAARAVLAGTATAQPKAGTGAMEMMRTLRVARQSAIKARTQAANELHALVITAPDAMCAQLRRLKIPQLVATAAAFSSEYPTHDTDGGDQARPQVDRHALSASECRDRGTGQASRPARGRGGASDGGD